jgi:hypothetical protein
MALRLVTCSRRTHCHFTATDKTGNIQPATDDAAIANKKTYWESNGQIIRQILVA